MDRTTGAASRALGWALALAAAVGCGDASSTLRPLTGRCERPESLLLGEGGAVSALGRLPDGDALRSAAGCADGGAASAFFAITLTRPRQVVLSVQSDAAVRAGFVDACDAATPECGRAARAVLGEGEHVIAVSGSPGAEVALGIATADPNDPPPVPDRGLGTCDEPTPVALGPDGTATIEIDWSGPQFTDRLDCSAFNDAVQVFELQLDEARAVRVTARESAIVEMRSADCASSDPVGFTCRRLSAGDALLRPRIPPGALLLLVAPLGDGERATLDIQAGEPPAPPDNVDCSAAVEIDLDQSVEVDFTGVRPEANPQCRAGYGLYYAFDLPSDRIVRLVEEQNDLVFGFYDAGCQPLANRACVDRDLCTRDGAGDLPAGRTVLRVDPWRVDMSAASPATGAFRLQSIEKYDPPIGDSCPDAPIWQIREGANEQRVSLRGATPDLVTGRPRVWRRIRIPFRADLVINGADRVFEGTECATLSGSRNQRELYGFPPGELIVALEDYADICQLAETETLRVTAFPTPAPPSNDDCAGAERVELIGGRFARIEGALAGAYDDFTTLRCPDRGATVVRGRDRVFVFDVAQPSRLRLTPLSSSFNLEGSIHAADACASPDALICFGRQGTLDDGVTIANPGTYYLRFDQSGTRTVDIEPEDFGFVIELEPL